jgi:hypothetical protein
MAKASREDVALWQGRREDYRKSGLSRKAFCERFRLKLSTLDYWFGRLRKQAGPEGMVELKGMAGSSSAASCLTLVVSERFRLEIPPACDMKVLGDVLRVLGGQS